MFTKRRLENVRLVTVKNVKKRNRNSTRGDTVATSTHK